MGIPMKNDYNLYDDSDYISKCDYRQKHNRSVRFQLWLGRKAYHERMGGDALGMNKTLEWLKVNYGISVSRDTLDRLCNPSDDGKFDLTLVLKLCEFWELDYDVVLALPGTSRLKKPERITSDWQILNDKRYAGKYYCYFFKITGDDTFTQEYEYTLRTKEDLIKATLDIKILDNEKATATLEYSNSASSHSASRKFATCTPLLSKLGNVYLDFVDNDGRVYKISFNYRDFPSQGDCYFRIASMLTESSDQVHFPLYQKMVMFRNEVEDSYLDHIRGILNHSDQNILIMPEMLEKLSDDLLVQKFMDNFCKPPHAKSPISFYHFNEAALMNTLSGMSNYELKLVLSKLRHYSFSPNQLIAGNDKDIHRIAKDLQTLESII